MKPLSVLEVPVKSEAPIKKLLLVGAGHAHIGLFRRLRTEHLADAATMNVEVTLITEQPQSIYSGMLPGWMAGHYDLDDISIDVKLLCEQAGVRFIQQPIAKVDAASCTVTTINNERFDYNVLSLNTGADTDMHWLNETATAKAISNTNTSTNTNTATTAAVIAIRPLSVFIDRWQAILLDAQQSSYYRLAIVGAGAAATELVMAAQFALKRINPKHQVYLVCGEHLLSGFNKRFKRRVISQLKRHGITMIHARATGYSEGQLLTLRGSSQESLPMDSVIAATGVTGAAWTECTDLETVDNGFVAVNATQQSVSHPNVFAVGDVATRVDQKVAHSGVHAVFGGAVEADNLLTYLAGKSLVGESIPSNSVPKKSLLNKPLKKYQPRTRTLYLLSCGDKYAIASWGRISLQGRWVWHLKRYIDKGFVK
ncbi:FAD-dependent oxidoreductase [Psychrobacter sp. 72-O-c]|uniref:FAD-dependent oxidoreductase n=1 Tax=Psychrobacter sp. 72-O-c TaxID=2774125 RepID=UPI00191A7BC6|nr:FAD-dependent oxidoreductase [Psychrobacter sp. 72-O-c]